MCSASSYPARERGPASISGSGESVLDRQLRGGRGVSEVVAEMGANIGHHGTDLLVGEKDLDDGMAFVLLALYANRVFIAVSREFSTREGYVAAPLAPPPSDI